MGVISGKDIYSAKYTTAEITDASGHIYFVPIKHVIGDYFLAELEKQIYAFRIDGNRIKTYRHTGVKSFRVLQYDTENYNPISAKDNLAIQKLLTENHLPRMNQMMFGLLKALGRKEKNLIKTEEFTPHELNKFVESLSPIADKYPEYVNNFTNFIENLGTNRIVTPTKKISEFIEDDLIAPDAKFLGDVFTSLQQVDTEHKVISNKPVTGKTAWLKIIVIMAIIGLGIGMAYMIYAGGYLNHLVPTFGPPVPTSNDLMKQYQTPEALSNAIKSGAVKCSDLSNDVKSMVNTVKPPVC